MLGAVLGEYVTPKGDGVEVCVRPLTLNDEVRELWALTPFSHRCGDTVKEEVLEEHQIKNYLVAEWARLNPKLFWNFKTKRPDVSDVVAVSYSSDDVAKALCEFFC
jgi:hypothetical protein